MIFRLLVTSHKILIYLIYNIMPITETIITIVSLFGTIVETIKCISDYLENREKEIRKLIAISCEYTYQTYIKQIKQIKHKQMTTDEYDNARRITVKYFRNKCSYYVSDKTLDMYINERMIYINNIKKNKN